MKNVRENSFNNKSSSYGAENEVVKLTETVGKLIRATEKNSFLQKSPYFFSEKKLKIINTFISNLNVLQV